MNVILISSIYYPTIGGVTTYTEELMNELIKKNINVKLFCPIYIEDYNLLDRKNKISKNIKYFIIDEKKKNDKGIVSGFFRKFSYNKKNKEILEEIKKYYNKKDTIIHQHDLISNFLLIKKLKRLGYKIILTNHTGETLLWKKLPFLGKKIIDYQFKFYDCIIGPSEELTYISKYREKSFYFPNSIRIEKKLNEEKSLKKKEENIFFCPRRWAPTKGIIYYLKAIKKLKEEDKELFEKCKFIFAGNDYDDYKEYKKECKEIVKDINSENIILLGDIKEKNKMEEFYLNSTYTIIPSLYEAVSLSALEAIVNGSLLISTNVGGMKSLIENEKTGLLCNSSSETELYNVILKSLKMSEKKYINILKNAYNIVYEKFNYEKLINKHIELYKKILKN